MAENALDLVRVAELFGSGTQSLRIPARFCWGEPVLSFSCWKTGRDRGTFLQRSTVINKVRLGALFSFDSPLPPV